MANKVCLVKAMVSPVVMYGCESWIIKKTESQRIDAFELWYWRRLLGVPQTARRSNQSILKEISPEYSLEGLMLKLKLQYYGHLMWRADSFEKTLMLGKVEGGRRRWRQRMRLLDGTQWTCVWVNSRSWWWTGRPGVLQFMVSQRVGHDEASELNDLMWLLPIKMRAEKSHFVFLPWRAGGPPDSQLAKLYMSLFSLRTRPCFSSLFPAVLDSAPHILRNMLTIHWQIWSSPATSSQTWGWVWEQREGAKEKTKIMGCGASL